MNGLYRLRCMSSFGSTAISGAAATSRRVRCGHTMLCTSQSPSMDQANNRLCHQYTTNRKFSSITRGQDLLEDSLAHGLQRKIILDSYGPSGFDVKGLIRVGEHPINDEVPGDDIVVHMNGSIVVFPHACFLWKIDSPKDITLESLAVVKLFKPRVEYLFIGCEKPMPPRELDRIKSEFAKGDNPVIVEQMDVMNAMGTFNILNGEDRRVACVLVKCEDVVE